MTPKAEELVKKKICALHPELGWTPGQISLIPRPRRGPTMGPTTYACVDVLPEGGYELLRVKFVRADGFAGWLDWVGPRNEVGHFEKGKHYLLAGLEAPAPAG